MNPIFIATSVKLQKRHDMCTLNYSEAVLWLYLKAKNILEALKSHFPWCSMPGLISVMLNTIRLCVWCNLTQYVTFKYADNGVW